MKAFLLALLVSIGMINYASSSRGLDLSYVCDAPVPVYWSQYGSGDAFWSPHKIEVDLSVNWHGYAYKGISSRIGLHRNMSGCSAPLVPLYRAFSSTNKDHFYTIHPDHLATAINTYGYIYEGTSGFVAADAGDCPGTRATYRYWWGTNHFYTSDLSQGNGWVAQGAKYEGIEGFMWPA